MGLPRLLSRSLWRASHLSSSSSSSSRSQPPILHISPLRLSGLALLHSSTSTMSSEKKPLGLTDSIMAQKIAENKSEENKESKGDSESDGEGEKKEKGNAEVAEI